MSNSAIPHRHIKTIWIFLLFLLLCLNYIAVNIFGANPFWVNFARTVFLGILLAGGWAQLKAINRHVLIVSLFCCSPLILGGPGNTIAINIVFTILFVQCTQHVDKKTIIKCGFWALSLSLLIVILLLELGISTNSIESIGDRERKTFGFSNTNAFSSLVYSFILTFILFWQKSSLVKYTTVALTSILIYLMTNNRSILIATALFFCARGILAIVSSRLLLNALLIPSLILPIGLTQISAYIVSHYPVIDILLSMRPSFSSQFIGTLPFYSYFLGGISPTPTATIDNSFLLIQASMGMPFLLILTWKTYTCMWHYINLRLLDVCAVILSFWFFCFSESNMVRPETTFGLVFWALLLQIPVPRRCNENSAN